MLNHAPGPDPDPASVGRPVRAAAGAATAASTRGIDLAATPFRLRDPALIPTRQWLYGQHLVRGFVSLTLAPGGVGKTALKVVEALDMVSGRGLLAEAAGPPLRVWIYNLEDPHDELERRVAAACAHYKLTAADLGDRLFVDSGRDQPLIVGETSATGNCILRPVVEALVAELRARRIDVLIVDPYVSCHRLAENDNGAMALLAGEFAAIAHRANCAVELVHHSRKLNGGEANADAARGGSALVAAARSVTALNQMTAADANHYGIGGGARRRHFRTSLEKANLAAPSDDDIWYRVVPVDLPNGDSVGVVERWHPPASAVIIDEAQVTAIQAAVAKTPCRADRQASEWVGYAVGPVLGLDSDNLADCKLISRIVDDLIRRGALRVVERRNEKREMKKFIDVGSPAPPRGSDEPSPGAALGP